MVKLTYTYFLLHFHVNLFFIFFLLCAILQHNSLAFVAGLKRATDEGSLPENAQYSPYCPPLNVFTASKALIMIIDATWNVNACSYEVSYASARSLRMRHSTSSVLGR